jgi:hypothetical protein
LRNPKRETRNEERETFLSHPWKVTPKEAVRIQEELRGKLVLKSPRKEFRTIAADAGKGFCRNCGYCLPCPEGIPIPDVFRYESYYRRNGLKDWAKEQYGVLASNGQACSDCQTCIEKCPYDVPIPSGLKEAHKILKST